jgi:hypothetical protein
MVDAGTEYIDNQELFLIPTDTNIGAFLELVGWETGAEAEASVKSLFLLKYRSRCNTSLTIRLYQSKRILTP